MFSSDVSDAVQFRIVESIVVRQSDRRELQLRKLAIPFHMNVDAYRPRSGTHRAGGDGGAPRVEDRLSPPLRERAGARFQEDRQYDDCIAGAALEGRSAGIDTRAMRPVYVIPSVRPRGFSHRLRKWRTADALASGASPSNRVGVQIPASAPHRQSDFHARAKAAQLKGKLILGRPKVWVGACKTAVESGVLLWIVR